MPSHYSRKHFKEETLLLSVHEVLRYLSSAFQPLFPRERIKGYKVLDQLHDTTKVFPMLALHCKFLVVSTLWSSPSQKELLRQPQCKMRSILGGYRDCTADVLLSRIQDVTGPPPPPQQHWKTRHSSAKLCVLRAAKPVFILEQCLLVVSL